MDFAAGTYYVTLESHGNYADLGQYVLRVDEMASSWSAQDIGMVYGPGYSSYNSSTGVYTLAGTGADIWGSNDGFQYLYQTLSGDGTITVRVTDMTDTASWAKSGVMFRDSLADNAKEAYLVATPDNGLQWSARTSTGGSTSAYTPNTGTSFSPMWLRITRSGNSFTAYKSTNGVTFTKFGSTLSVSMGTNIYVGLVCSSVNQGVQDGALNTCTFSNVTLTGTLNPGPPLNALPAPTGLTITAATSNSINLSWNDISGDGGYSIERSSDSINFSQAGTTAVNITTFADSSLSDNQQYFYRVRALGGGGTVSDSSTVVNGVTRAGAVTNIRIISYTTSELVLDWSDASGETGYRIERSPNGTSNWTTIGSVGRNVPIFANTGLAGNTRYYYRVVTLDGGGDAATSAVVSRYTRLAAASGLRFTGKAPDQISISWNAVAGAASYRIERSTDGITYSTLASNLSNTGYSDNAVTPLGEYYYRVLGVNSDTEGVLSTVIFTAAPAAAALPTPWLTADIGSVGGAGGAKYNNGTFTLVGGGAEIFWGSDEFRYVYKTLSGNGSFTARVTSVEETNYWAKAGLMIRESTAINAKHAMVYISPHLAVFQSRTATGGNVTDVYGPSVTAPYYVRITRNGTLFTGEISPDGATWTTVGSRTISMNTNVLIGFALTSRDDNYLNTSTFTITPDANAAPTVATPAAATPSPVGGTTAALSVLGNDDHGEGNLTYTWSATSVPSGAPTPTYSANGINTAKNVTVTFGKAGFYTFRVTITDTSGLLVFSTVNVTVNQTLTNIIVNPTSATLRGGQMRQFTAAGYDQFGAVMSPQPAYTWSASSGSIDVDTGMFTAPYTPGATITITATSGAIQKSAIANISNTPPSGILLSNSLLDENQAGAVVGTLTTVDPDQGQTYAYLLLNDPTNKFEIVDATLQLKAGQSLDYETLPNVDLQIQTTDSGGSSYTKTLSITIVDQIEMLVAGPSDWTDVGLTLTLGGDGKLHLYRTGSTTDAVPPHNPVKVAGVNLAGRGTDDILIDDYPAVFADLLFDHATLLVNRDDAFSSDTNVTVNGGVLNFNGYGSPLGNLTLTNDGRAYLAALNNSTTTVTSGVLTAASIVCDTLTIGSASGASAGNAGADMAVQAVEAPSPVAAGIAPRRATISPASLDSPAITDRPMIENAGEAFVSSTTAVSVPSIANATPMIPQEVPLNFTPEITPLARLTEQMKRDTSLFVKEPELKEPDLAEHDGTLFMTAIAHNSLAHAFSSPPNLIERLKDSVYGEWIDSLAATKKLPAAPSASSRNTRSLALQSIIEGYGDNIFPDDSELLASGRSHKQEKPAKKAIDDLHAVSLATNSSPC